MLIFVYMMYKVLVCTSQKTQSAYIENTSWWILYKAVSAVYRKNHVERINTLYGQSTKPLVLSLEVLTVITGLWRLNESN
jgi:hypothetical protein